MRYKKRPKNKQEIDDFSGSKRKPIEPKIKISFQFTDRQGVSYKPPVGRLKIDQNCGVSCLILKDGKWHPIKAHLDFIRKKK